MGVGAQSYAMVALPPGKTAGTHFVGDWWAPGPAWMGTENLAYRDSIPDSPGRSEWLYLLRCLGPTTNA
jgi:hypothetical protein